MWQGVGSVLLSGIAPGLHCGSIFESWVAIVGGAIGYIAYTAGNQKLGVAQH
jgi:hypothetical protein